MMSRTIKILLVIGSVILSGVICGIAYTVQLNPYGLNTFLFLLGFALMAGGVTYVFIKVINKIVN
jgi:hypothetical protein